MYVVLVPSDMSKSKVLPSFLVEPMMNTTRKQGKFLEVRTKDDLTLLVKPYTIKRP